MELRRKEKDVSIPTSFCYNQAYQPNQESSSSKLSSVSATVIPTERINEAGLLDPTLDQSHDGHLPHHHRHSNPHVPERDPNPDPLPPPPQPQPATISEATNRAPWIRYRECLKNHAATMGSHVVDGCGEFMSGGDEGTPEALKCAACDCHRNFHRKDVEGEPQTAPNSFYTYNPNPNINNSSRTKIHPTQVPPPLPPPPPPPPPPNHHHNIYAHGHHHHHAFSTSPPVMLGFGGNRRAPAESSSEDLPPPSLSGSKKRFRTKFTQEQKDRMQEFGEKLVWKIQKQDEQEVQQFCAEVGVTRQVFKVWMHNNKQAMKKKHL